MLQIAIKKMPLNAQNVKLLTSEIHIMKESSHPNVVRYLDSFRVEDKLWVSSVLSAGMMNCGDRSLSLTTAFAAYCPHALSGGNGIYGRWLLDRNFGAVRRYSNVWRQHCLGLPGGTTITTTAAATHGHNNTPTQSFWVSFLLFIPPHSSNLASLPCCADIEGPGLYSQLAQNS